MKASPTPPRSINWAAVLGPLLASATAAATATATATAAAGEPAELPVAELPVAELPALEAATFAHVRRAVRPRRGLEEAELPFASQPVPWFPRGRFVLDSITHPSDSYPPATHQPASVRPGAFLQHAAGDYYIQDAGSMLALALCDVRPGEWVCDTCAAPGGKATGLLEALDGQGVLVANEVIRSRLGILALALARSGYGNYLSTNLELERLGQVCGRAFDCVLVDAPCTGQTMVAQGKQSMAAFGESQIAHSSRRQQRLLRTAAELVKPMGRLVYSTCAYSYAENEQVVFDFLDQRPGWRLAPCARLGPWQSPLAAGCYRVWPHRHGCRGAFAALLINDSYDGEGAHLQTAKTDRGGSRRAPSRWQAVGGLPAQLAWMGLDPQAQWWQTQGHLHRFPVHIPSQWIESAVGGCEIAHVQAERAASTRAAAKNMSTRWQPSFGACMLAVASTTAPCCELDDSQALRYVAGETIPYAAEDASWCLVTWRGRRLSWGKLTQGALKNHFPKALRQPAVVAGTTLGR